MGMFMIHNNLLSIYLGLMSSNDTWFNKYKKGNTIFKNRQTSDKLLTLTVNCNNAKAKWEQLIQIIENKGLMSPG